MRITVFDDDGNELAQGSVRGLKLDSRKQSMDIEADVVVSWHSLQEGGGRSVVAQIDALMEYLAASGKTVVSYSSGELHGNKTVNIATRGLYEALVGRYA
jgi:hypothetical protein